MSDEKDWSKRQEQFKGSAGAGAQTARRRRETTSVRKHDRSAAVAKRRLVAPAPETAALGLDGGAGSAAAAAEAFTAEVAFVEASAAVRVLLAPPGEAELLAAVNSHPLSSPNPCTASQTQTALGYKKKLRHEPVC
jgi:hypothetical protein